MSACVGPDTGSGFLSATLAHLDCQAQSIGGLGFETFAANGSVASSLVAGLLGLFIALFGFRLIRGDTISFGFLIDNAIKIGLVLALATSWPAYRTLVYDVTLKAPAELFESIVGASDLPGADGGLVARLQNVDTGILALVAAGTGALDATRRDVAQPLPAKTPVDDGFALGLGRTFYLAGIIGALGLLRLSGGLLLALGPIMAGFLLFEATRSFFWGWVRSLVAVALGALSTTIVLAVELALLEPWMARVLDLRAAYFATPEAPFELLALTLSFALVLGGALLGSARLAFFVMPNARAPWQRPDPSISTPSGIFVPPTPMMAPAPGQQLVLEQAAQMQRTLHGIAAAPAMVSPVAPDRAPERMRDYTETGGVVPLGQTYKRTMTRTSALAARRSQSQ